MNALRNLEESMGYARQVELDLLCKMMDSYFIFTPLKDFVTKLMHIIVDLNMNMIDDEKFTNTKTEFLKQLRIIVAFLMATSFGDCICYQLWHVMM